MILHANVVYLVKYVKSVSITMASVPDRFSLSIFTVSTIPPIQIVKNITVSPLHAYVNSNQGVRSYVLTQETTFYPNNTIIQNIWWNRKVDLLDVVPQNMMDGSLMIRFNVTAYVLVNYTPIYKDVGYSYLKMEHQDYCSLFKPSNTTLRTAIATMSSVNNYIHYDLGLVDANLTVEQVYHEKRGVCRHFAELYAAVMKCGGLDVYKAKGWVYMPTIRKWEPHAWNILNSHPPMIVDPTFGVAGEVNRPRVVSQLVSEYEGKPDEIITYSIRHIPGNFSVSYNLSVVKQMNHTVIGVKAGCGNGKLWIMFSCPRQTCVFPYRISLPIDYVLGEQKQDGVMVIQGVRNVTYALSRKNIKRLMFFVRLPSRTKTISLKCTVDEQQPTGHGGVGRDQSPILNPTAPHESSGSAQPQTSEENKKHNTPCLLTTLLLGVVLCFSALNH